MESRCNSKPWCGDGGNHRLHPSMVKDITTSYDYSLFVKVIIGAIKNNIEYKLLKNDGQHQETQVREALVETY